MGDALSEQAGVDAILAANFDAEKALDQLLKSSVPKLLKETARPAAKEKAVPTIQGNPIFVHNTVEICTTKHKKLTSSVLYGSFIHKFCNCHV